MIVKDLALAFQQNNLNRVKDLLESMFGDLPENLYETSDRRSERFYHRKSPGVCGVGLRYCGPMPMNIRPCPSKAMEHGLRTSGSLAHKLISKPSATTGMAFKSAPES